MFLASGSMVWCFVAAIGLAARPCRYSVAMEVQRSHGGSRAAVDCCMQPAGMTHRTSPHMDMQMQGGKHIGLGFVRNNARINTALGDNTEHRLLCAPRQRDSPKDRGSSVEYIVRPPRLSSLRNNQGISSLLNVLLPKLFPYEI